MYVSVHREISGEMPDWGTRQLLHHTHIYLDVCFFYDPWGRGIFRVMKTWHSQFLTKPRLLTAWYQYCPPSWWRHQMETFPRHWTFVRGIHRSRVNSAHKGQWRGALMFSLICAWMKGWVNNREAGDLRLLAPIMTSLCNIFWFKFHCNMFPKIKLTTGQHQLRECFFAEQAVSTVWLQHCDFCYQGA